MPRPLKWGILGASTIILSKDINKYAFMCGSNFYESDVTLHCMFVTIASRIQQRVSTQSGEQFVDVMIAYVTTTHPDTWVDNMSIVMGFKCKGCYAK